MGLRTVYCVQTFEGPRGRQVKGRLRQFATEEDALAAGRGLQGRSGGVLVFRVSGEPDFDWWDEPVILVRHGMVPTQYM